MDLKRLIIGKFSWRRLLSSIVIVYVIINLFVYYYSEQLIFPYNQSSYNNKLSGLKIIKTQDGNNLATRFWQAKDEKYLVLYFHGNYLDLGNLDEIAEKFNKKGYSILAMDYRGYGLSQGYAAEETSYLDSQLLYKEAINMGYTSKNIIILGRSIGSGVATELASKNKAKILVLVSPFVTAFRVVTTIPILPFDRFDNLAKINKISQALFIIHGADDKIIQPWHSEVLFNKFKGNKQRYLIRDAGHNDIWDYNKDKLFDELDGFIDNPNRDRETQIKAQTIGE